ncbi:MAG: response regulator, partial [Anaerolineae bacterium]|nr:response regulator [Anaerolineae bacterium]
YVKDALASFYDPVHLQTHPLTDLLSLPPSPQETRGQLLRQLLREAIDSLRPSENIPFGRPEWLGYRIMWLRYVESLDQSRICRELGISRASFYRYHQEAFAAVVSILWDRYLTQEKKKGAPPVSAEADALVKKEAHKALSSSRQRPVDLTQVLAGVQRTILPLVKQQGVSLQVREPDQLPTTYGDPAILRQIILNVLTEGMRFAADDSLELQIKVASTETVWRLRGLDGEHLRDLKEATGVVASRSLLSAYGGKLWFEGGKLAPCLCFSIPTITPKTILIIDDDPDTINLYQRYLQAGRYSVQVATNSEEVWGFLEQGKPDLILLDVLMPQEDGWDILQRLKTLPELREVPVIICSVLSQPQLALALGALEVLQKPIDQLTLLQTVERALTARDTAEQAR